MDFALLYWHWIVFGIALMLSEIFLGSFFIFWFGAAATVVGLLLIPFPGISVVAQILMWAVSSTAFALAWFKILKPLNIDRTKAGLSREALLFAPGESQDVVFADAGDYNFFCGPHQGAGMTGIIHVN